MSTSRRLGETAFVIESGRGIPTGCYAKPISFRGGAVDSADCFSSRADSCDRADIHCKPHTRSSVISSTSALLSSSTCCCKIPQLYRRQPTWSKNEMRKHGSIVWRRCTVTMDRRTTRMKKDTVYHPSPVARVKRVWDTNKIMSVKCIRAYQRRRSPE